MLLRPRPANLPKQEGLASPRESAAILQPAHPIPWGDEAMIKSKKVSDTVTLDRRSADPRKAGAAWPKCRWPRSTPRPRREKVNRRRQIDPTTCKRNYSDQEVEFMHALDNTSGPAAGCSHLQRSAGSAPQPGLGKNPIDHKAAEPADRWRSRSQREAV